MIQLYRTVAGTIPRLWNESEVSWSKLMSGVHCPFKKWVFLQRRKYYCANYPTHYKMIFERKPSIAVNDLSPYCITLIEYSQINGSKSISPCLQTLFDLSEWHQCKQKRSHMPNKIIQGPIISGRQS